MDIPSAGHGIKTEKTFGNAMKDGIRDYIDADADRIAEMIDREWKISEYGGDWHAACRMLVDFWMKDSDIRKVCLHNGQIAGVVSATVRPGHTPIPEGLGDLGVSDSMANDLLLLTGADDEILETADIGGFGRLDLLMVSEDCKGKGIGGKLFTLAAEYLRSEGCKGVYWATDTDCNTGFYNHIGARPIGQRDLVLSAEELTRFIYVLHLRRRLRTPG